MLGALLRRVEASLDNVVGQLINRAMVVLPFLMATGFATVALLLWCNRLFGAELANLLLAAVYAIAGIVAAALMPQGTDETADAASPAGDEQPADAVSTDGSAVLSGADHDLLTAALSSAAPAVAPGVGKAVVRNLPLVTAVVAALMVMGRHGEEDEAPQVKAAE